MPHIHLPPSQFFVCFHQPHLNHAFRIIFFGKKIFEKLQGQLVDRPFSSKIKEEEESTTIKLKQVF
jgi:hypothetical protein